MQTYLAGIATNYLSDKLKTRVQIKGVNIEFFNKLVLEGVYIEDQKKDTLLNADKIKLLVKILDLENLNIQIKETKLIGTTIKLTKYKGDKFWNYKFIEEAFAVKKDTAVKDSAQAMHFFCHNFYLENTRFLYSNYNYEHSDSDIVDFDYIAINGLNGHFENIQLYEDSVTCYLENISFKEKSGFGVRSLSSNVVIASNKMHFDSLKLFSNNSEVNGLLEFNYNNIDDFDDFINKVTLTANFNNSFLNLKDISHFSSELRGINKTVGIKYIEAKGTINDFSAKNIDLYFGKSSTITGKLKMVGLPDINNTLIDFRIKKLVSNKQDIEGIPLPPFTKRKYIELPREIAQLGKVTYVGDYTGFYNDFVTFGKFTTDLGTAQTDIKINYDLNTNITSYSGKLITENFYIGKLIKLEQNVGKVTAKLNIKGSEFDIETIKANLDGQIRSLELNDYTYQNISIKGDIAKKLFKGDLSIEDPNLNFDFLGTVDFKGKQPYYDFSAQINKAELNELKLITGKDIYAVKGIIDLKIKGNNIDDAQGNIILNELNISKNKVPYNLGDINFSTFENNGQKTILLNSAYIDAEVNGQFNMRDVTLSFKNLMHYYLNALFNEPAVLDLSTKENFTYKIDLKNTQPLLDIFIPEISIAKQSSFNGFYNNEQHAFNLTATIPYFNYNNIKVKSAYIESTTENGKLQGVVKAERVNFSDSTYIENVDVTLDALNNNISYFLKWKNEQAFENYANINGIAAFESDKRIKLKLNPSEIALHDSIWTISENNEILIDTGIVYIKNLQFSTSAQHLNVNGIISDKNYEKIDFSISNFNLANFNVLLKQDEIDLQGIVNGTGSVSGVSKDFNLSAAVDFKQLKFNGEDIGSGNVISVYDGVENVVKMNGNFLNGMVNTIQFSGKYSPNDKVNNLDFDLSLNKTPLKLISPFMIGILSEIHGSASGKLKLSGTTKTPVLTGNLEAFKCGFKVDYLNTSYTFSNPVLFKPGSIEMLNATLFDEKGDEAITNFKLFHNGFKDFRIDLVIDAKKFYCLNTNEFQNELFYGKAFATGLIKIYGPVEKLNIDIAAKTEKGTKFFIPLSSPEEINEISFVQFLSKDTTKIKQHKQLDLTGIQMNFDLEVTPDAETQIIFDQKVGDIIKGRGNGNIKMEINTAGQFNMYGDFIITSGEYLFTLKNVINKRFKIEPGGSIRWSGDPYEARINLAAIYSVKTSLAPILPADSNQRSVPVNCKLKLTDKLMNPNVAFEVELASNSIDQSKKDEFNSVIRPDNVQEVNRQVLALLLLGSFVTPSSNTTNATRIDYAPGSNSMELLTNQLNNWLSTITKSFNVGFKYKPGTQATSQQMEVALSTQLFNDKLLINGNFGVNGTGKTTSTTTSTTNNNNIVGDFKMEYKLTEDGKVRLKAYNQTNDYSLLVNTAPYTQGVGIFYREEFNSLGDLYKRYFKKKRKLPEDTLKTKLLPPETPDSTRIEIERQ